jgi:hypothetical protein
MWARLDDAILDNPKIIAAGPLGFALHVAAITWCARNLTDGLIPKRRVPQLLDIPSLQVSETTKVRVLHALTPDDLAADLERIGLWHDRGENWEVHDYLVYNLSKDEILARRERERTKKAKQRLHLIVSPQVSPGDSRGNLTHPVPVPVPKEEEDPPLASLGPPQSARAARSLRATQWPQDFTLTDERRALAVAAGLEAAPEWNAFRDCHQAKGSRFVNWDAAWRTWLRRAPDFHRSRA